MTVSYLDTTTTRFLLGPCCFCGHFVHLEATGKRTNENMVNAYCWRKTLLRRSEIKHVLPNLRVTWWPVDSRPFLMRTQEHVKIYLYLASLSRQYTDRRVYDIGNNISNYMREGLKRPRILQHFDNQDWGRSSLLICWAGKVGSTKGCCFKSSATVEEIYVICNIKFLPITNDLIIEETYKMVWTLKELFVDNHWPEIGSMLLTADWRDLGLLTKRSFGGAGKGGRGGRFWHKTRCWRNGGVWDVEMGW